MNIRTAEAGRGTGWLLEGFGYFSKDAVIWIVTVVILVVAWIAISLVPLLGGIATQILWFIVVGGLMLGLREQDEGGSLRLGHMLAGFNAAAGQLALVGVLYLVGLLLITIVMAVLLLAFLGAGALSQIQASGVESMEHLSLLLVPLLIGLALSVPLIMASWFAPALVVFNGLGAVDAMLLSFRACLSNVVPFILYGIVALVLAIVATIPLLLGWLVLFPMMIASVYIAYKEIFVQEAPATS
jgi:uncharacterized membrane protein